MVPMTPAQRQHTYARAKRARGLCAYGGCNAVSPAWYCKRHSMRSSCRVQIRPELRDKLIVTADREKVPLTVLVEVLLGRGLKELGVAG